MKFDNGGFCITHLGADFFSWGSLGGEYKVYYFPGCDVNNNNNNNNN
jgi:hypothetical protein